MHPVEIKSGQTYTGEMVAGLEKWLRFLTQSDSPGRRIFRI